MWIGRALLMGFTLVAVGCSLLIPFDDYDAEYGLDASDDYDKKEGSDAEQGSDAAPSSSGPKNCETLCAEAQAGDCAGFKGSCRDSCAAVESAAFKAGCAPQREAHEECLNSTERVCLASCKSTVTALEDCLRPYCLLHPFQQDCKTALEAL